METVSYSIRLANPTNLDYPALSKFFGGVLASTCSLKPGLHAEDESLASLIVDSKHKC